MVPGSVPRPVDGAIRYTDGRLTGYRVFAYPASACPRENSNAIVNAAGRARQPKPVAVNVTGLKPDPIAAPATAFPPDPPEDDKP